MEDQGKYKGADSLPPKDQGLDLSKMRVPSHPQPPHIIAGRVTVPSIEKLPRIVVGDRLAKPDPDPNPFAGLEAMAAAVHAVNKANGFWDHERNIGEMLMLVTSELAEALEAHRKGRVHVRDWALELSERPDADITSDNSAYREFVKDHFEAEIIDALFRILDMIAGLNIPAERIAALVLKANAQRGHKHGKQY